MPYKNSIPKTHADFNAISLKLASPEKILDWSYGEVTKPETINYRSGRSERGGLFDERIFGPEKDYECYCGKYKRIRYKDIVCEKCGVEVTRSVVRRERMGHIELAVPVAHIWFLRNIPSRMALILNTTVNDLEKVIYFAGYIIIDVNQEEKAKALKELNNEYKQRVKSAESEEEKSRIKDALIDAKRQLDSLVPWKVLDESTFHRLSMKYSTVFEAGIGAEAVYRVFQNLDLDTLSAELEDQIDQVSAVDRVKVQKRHNLVNQLKKSGNRPEWMFLKNIPVIPPALRPMVPLDGGRHATSDANDLYRRVINRNNRLKRLIDLHAPEVILRNEKRILQEAVDALIDGSARSDSEGSAGQLAGRRPLKSLAENLRGKQGRFRQNLLGKRVDYSGRSVIVVGPNLKVFQCGLPKHMALELFRPFIVAKILSRELAYNIRGAGRLIDEGVPEVWAILEEVTRDKYVLLNRAPTLHRLGIQAFKPVLIEGNAIQIHPLVCSAFNADFDGDQMAVHVPLSAAAQKEAREIVASDQNLLKPGSGDPVANMKLDIVLGCYWVTKIVDDQVSENRYFSTPNEAIMAYDAGHLNLRSKIKVIGGKISKYGELSGQLIETSVGRLLFNNTLPKDYHFVNTEITTKEINRIVDDLVFNYESKVASQVLDSIKNFGFYFATYSGVTWGIDDVKVPGSKKEMINAGHEEAAKIEERYENGLLSSSERYRMIIELWTKVKNQIEESVPQYLDPNGSVVDMIKSGARGSFGQVSQMAGMKGLIMNPGGRLIDFPVTPSYKEGLSPIEYFTTTHGSRKGLADTALNTARAGYLTRKLVDVAQEIVVTEKDCGDEAGKQITEEHVLGFDEGIGNNVVGRILLEAVEDQEGKEVLPKGHLVTHEDAKLLEEKGIYQARVRTPLTCQSAWGVCQKCYGMDLGRGKMVNEGEAVGIVAAQAIGEPGTQLTMRTKHAGGVDTGGDIVGGLPRVEELFERRKPKNNALLATVDGKITDIKTTDKDHTITVLIDPASRKKHDKKETISYTTPYIRNIAVTEGQEIKKGDILTDGSVDLMDYFKLAGRQKVEDYIIKEINAIYELQGVSISRKHIELIIRQMMSRRRVKNPGDTRFNRSTLVEYVEAVEENRKVQNNGGQPAEFEPVVLGISEVALTTASFLSAASFQHTNRVLIDTAVRGGLDKLRGLKENVIIGRLIPAGTGLIPDYEEKANQEAGFTTDEYHSEY